MRRPTKFWIAFVVLGLIVANARAEESVKIGVLHSLSGTMAISEVSLRDAVLMAVEEINAAGGVMGTQIEPVVVDPASDWDLFAEKSKELLLEHEVASVFGCWTSVSRKSVLPVFEENKGLLFYPVQYEGEECSRKHHLYWGYSQPAVDSGGPVPDERGRRRVQEVSICSARTTYSRARANKKSCAAYLLDQGVPEANIMEEYTPFHHQDYQDHRGRRSRVSPPMVRAAVLSTINGDSNVPFYKEFANQGLTFGDVPDHGLLQWPRDELRGDGHRIFWSAT